MSKILITLNKADIANLLLGGEVSRVPSVSKFDNLREVVIKQEEYLDDYTVEEDD